MFYDGPYSGSSNNGGLIGFWLDDTKLVNNTGTDYDLMQDGPAQNYSTLNPLIGPSTAPGPSVINTAAANLQAGPNQSGSDGFVNSTVLTNRDVYVECTVQDVQNQIEIGFVEDQVRFGGGTLDAVSSALTNHLKYGL